MLIRNATAILTGLDGAAARWDVAAHGGDIRITGDTVTAIGRLAPEPGEAQIDATDCVVHPGWVNTHHHLFQSLLKGIPSGLDLPLSGWLSAVPVSYRRHFGDADGGLLRLAARIGLVELLLSGCSTVADHQYLNYPGQPYDASAIVFDEAEKLGLRLVLCRGGQTIRRDVDREPPPESAPETLQQFLAGVERDAARFHDPAPRAMRRVVLAPSTPNWSVQPEELRVMALEARRLGLRLHSHLSETADYVRWAREVKGCTPVAFCAEHGWLGPDVWFAHMVHLSADEIALLAATGTGIAHCPQSNGRLGSGVAPVPALLAAGVPVGLAVDGAASNEAADMAHEAHCAWLTHRAVGGAAALTTDQVMAIGTAGGGRVLGLDVGTLAPGAAADLAVVALDSPRHFGLHDPGAAPVASGAAGSLRALLVAGRVVARDGQIPGLDLAEVGAQARAAVRHIGARHPR